MFLSSVSLAVFLTRGGVYMKLRKIYLTQSRKDAKEITDIMFYLGALASLRENKQFLF